MERGKLFVVSAPSGCGKGTILAEILKDEKYYYSVSATTRAPREAEVEGKHYHFLKRDVFEAKIAQGEFLEHAIFCDNHYGTLIAPIEENLARGKHVILEIEVQGAMQVKALRPDAVFLFIAPPSIKTLHERLVTRGTEEMDVINQRVAQAAEELKCASQYHYTVVNDVLADAIADFKAIVRAEELKNETK